MEEQHQKSTTPKRKFSKRTKIILWVVCGLALIGLNVGIFLIAYAINLEQIMADNLMSGVDKVRGWIEGSGAAPVFMFMLLQYVSMFVVFIPAGAISFCGGMLFGPLVGFFAAFVMCIAGNMTTFFLSRILGRKFVERMVSKRNLTRYEKYINGENLTLTTVFMLIPTMPADVLSYILGLTKIKWWKYLIICFLGRPWRTLLYVLLGSIAFAGLPVWYYIVITQVAIAAMILSLLYGDKLEAWVYGLFTRNREQGTENR
ncbi:MAG: TVP38/TMEM64 family protein [Firmicutes bacterium]|nr:TVP38/TMEM64 family protein [Bacillota bacterium]